MAGGTRSTFNDSPRWLLLPAASVAVIVTAVVAPPPTGTVAVNVEPDAVAAVPLIVTRTVVVSVTPTDTSIWAALVY